MGALDTLFRYGQPAATLLSGAAAEPLAGLAGLLSGNADNVGKVREAMTYQPSTDAGQGGLQDLGSVFNSLKKTFVDDNPPVRKMVDGYSSLSDAAGDLHPALGAAMKTLPTAATLLAGPGSAAMRGAFGSVASDLKPVVGTALDKYMQDTGMQLNAVKPTVKAQRIAYPGIYGNPRELAAEAASRVAPEDAALKQLFGVTREDLWDIGQQGTRQGSLLNTPYKVASNPRGADASFDVMNNKNAGRIQDIISEAMEHPELYKPMASWYVNDPLYTQFQRLHGDKAAEEFNRFNALTGMSSPGSEVLTELNRGTAANWLAKDGRWDDFMKYGGYGADRRAADATFPVDMGGVMGHPYHSTAQAPAMDKYITGGQIDMKSAKVPSYIQASGTPEVGFQTDFPVADAHFSRLVGLADTRGPKFNKGVEVVPKQSASVSEVHTMTPWWRDQVAEPMGLKAVPAQAVVWGAGSGATGVTSPIGAPKLELLAQQIMKTAQRLGISPEHARDMVLTGKTYAGDGKGGLASLLDE